MGATKIWRRDATNLGDNNDKPYNLIFLDPPYRKGLGQKALTSAKDGGWIAEGALIICECAADEDTPEFAELLDERKYGETRILIGRV